MSQNFTDPTHPNDKMDRKPSTQSVSDIFSVLVNDIFDGVCIIRVSPTVVDTYFSGIKEIYSNARQTPLFIILC